MTMITGSRRWWQSPNKHGAQGIVDVILRLLEQGEISRSKARELIALAASYYADDVMCERCRSPFPDDLPGAPWDNLNWCDDVCLERMKRRREIDDA